MEDLNKMSDEILDPLEIVKRGETSLTVSLSRSTSGLMVAVKAHPRVEAFMKSLGNGDVLDVKAAGPYWRAIPRDGVLHVYTLTEVIPSFNLENGTAVTITRVGMALYEPFAAQADGSKAKPLINLSFLRLAGISEGAGVTFSVRGVHTHESLSKIKEDIGEGYRKFYYMFMKPIRMDIVVSTQETVL